MLSIHKLQSVAGHAELPTARHYRHAVSKPASAESDSGTDSARCCLRGNGITRERLKQSPLLRMWHRGNIQGQRGHRLCCIAATSLDRAQILGFFFGIALTLVASKVSECLSAWRSGIRSSGIHIALHHARTAHTTNEVKRREPIVRRTKPVGLKPACKHFRRSCVSSECLPVCRELWQTALLKRSQREPRESQQRKRENKL